MKKILISILFLLFFLGITNAQSLDEWHKRIRIITAESGLNMRENPSVSSKKIVTVPFRAEIVYDSNSHSYSTIIEGKMGDWIKCFYQGYEGYIFSGYTAEVYCHNEKAKVVIPQHALIDDRNITISCDNYIGLFTSEFIDSFIINTILLQDTTVNYTNKLAGKMSDSINPLFIISGIEIITNTIYGVLVDKMIYPFESMVLGNRRKDTNQLFYTLHATGDGILNSVKNAIKPFLGINNYALQVREITGDSMMRQQIIYTSDLHYFSPNMYEGEVKIFWKGDLNNDDIPDIIMYSSPHYASKEYYLLLSNEDGEEIYTIHRVGGGSTC